MRLTCSSILVAALFVGISTAARANDYCGDTDAARARAMVYTIGTWRELYFFYQHYEGCTDDGVAEGVSDRVADLLANHWDTFGALLKITNEYPKFEHFVFYHIDSVMRPEQAKTIIDNAHNHCPADGTELCGKIEHEVEVSTKQ